MALWRGRQPRLREASHHQMTYATVLQAEQSAMQARSGMQDVTASGNKKDRRKAKISVQHGIAYSYQRRFAFALRLQPGRARGSPFANDARFLSPPPQSVLGDMQANGIYVSQIEMGSPAENVGLQIGDEILAINDVATADRSLDELYTIMTVVRYIVLEVKKMRGSGAEAVPSVAEALQYQNPNQLSHKDEPSEFDVDGIVSSSSGINANQLVRNLLTSKPDVGLTVPLDNNNNPAAIISPSSLLPPKQAPRSKPLPATPTTAASKALPAAPASHPGSQTATATARPGPGSEPAPRSFDPPSGQSSASRQLWGSQAQPFVGDTSADSESDMETADPTTVANTIVNGISPLRSALRRPLRRAISAHGALVTTNPSRLPVQLYQGGASSALGRGQYSQTALPHRGYFEAPGRLQSRHQESRQPSVQPSSAASARDQASTVSSRQQRLQDLEAQANKLSSRLSGLLANTRREGAPEPNGSQLVNHHRPSAPASRTDGQSASSERPLGPSSLQAAQQRPQDRSRPLSFEDAIYAQRDNGEPPTFGPLFEIDLEPQQTSLGMRVAGGSATRLSALFVAHLEPGGAADRTGEVQVGDRILRIGQHDVAGLTQEQFSRLVTLQLSRTPYGQVPRIHLTLMRIGRTQWEQLQRDAGIARFNLTHKDPRQGDSISGSGNMADPPARGASADQSEGKGTTASRVGTAAKGQGQREVPAASTWTTEAAQIAERALVLAQRVEQRAEARVSASSRTGSSSPRPDRDVRSTRRAHTSENLTMDVGNQSLAKSAASHRHSAPSLASMMASSVYAYASTESLTAASPSTSRTGSPLSIRRTNSQPSQLPRQPNVRGHTQTQDHLPERANEQDGPQHEAQKDAQGEAQHQEPVHKSAQPQPQESVHKSAQPQPQDHGQSQDQGHDQFQDRELSGASTLSQHDHDAANAHLAGIENPHVGPAHTGPVLQSEAPQMPSMAAPQLPRDTRDAKEDAPSTSDRSDSFAALPESQVRPTRTASHEHVVPQEPTPSTQRRESMQIMLEQERRELATQQARQRSYSMALEQKRLEEVQRQHMEQERLQEAERRKRAVQHAQRRAELEAEEQAVEAEISAALQRRTSVSQSDPSRRERRASISQRTLEMRQQFLKNKNGGRNSPARRLPPRPDQAL
ncbi:uncharacterized protein MONBRDRAFT_36040 [Monosiga brevicollis MX1]|uniref:PDZ domain-containing protein n=1 Tax=Monosiga brevicollis TaxID=81824 RepID=A9URH9_MONBE|nr:uncharacterized protein MONBRDRAFT_36040 [Monosiga brevicollis MX1]EDQ92246.1 predicted protein [Monosiga brevicollis MX1]|eukprot:XP_001743532.1 hypothetical protein [Monosiga brevicollis MX1]